MATAEVSNNPADASAALPPPDRYRGAVVEVTHNPSINQERPRHLSDHLANDLSLFLFF